MLRKKKNFSKANIIITILVFSVILFMGTGYAVLVQILDINGNSKLEIPDYRIYISDVKVLSTSGSGYASSVPTYTNNEVALYTALPNMSSSVTYEITIKNTGNSNAIVDYLYSANSNLWSKYKIDGINATESIPRLSVLKVKVTVEPSENSSNDIDMNSFVMLNFAFLKASDSYSNACTVQWDGSSSSQPVSTNIFGTDYYQISNANEFKWFMEQVNGGNNSINAMLTNDICLNNKSFTPIASNSAYAGMFDGQNRSISGISFSRDQKLTANTTYSVGFFMNNTGFIKNINIAGNYSDIHNVSTRTSTLYMGGVVVNNSGIIENVSFNGSINLSANAHVNCTVRDARTTNYVGGIVSSNTGIVRGSYNNAIFTLNGSTTQACNLYERTTNVYAGAIVSNNTGFVSDSYNKASMSFTGDNESDYRSTINASIGGVTSINSSVVKNSYNSGSITKGTTSNKGDYNYKTDVVAENTGIVNNVYLLSGSATNDDGVYNGAVVGTNDLINLTGSVTLGTGFKKDTLKINSGYPVLYWQKN